MRKNNYTNYIKNIALFLIISLALTSAAFADSAGPNNPEIAIDDASTGTENWLNPERVDASDDSRARVLIDDFEISHYIKATDFNFSIPSNAIIEGIVVDVERKVDSTNGGSIVRDAAVRIVKGGVIGSEDRSTLTNYTLNDTNESHGDLDDLWGEVWTAADINSNDFGAAVAVQKANNASSDRTVAIDNIEIIVYYNIPADTTAPTTTKNIEGQEVITTNTEIVLSADDGDGTGVSSTSYRVYACGTETGEFSVYTGPFTIDEDGCNTIDFFSVDNSNNFEELHSQNHTVTLSLSSGPNNPEIAVDDAGIGTKDWLNPERVNASDDSRARVLIDDFEISHYIKATDFNFSIPSNAIIEGIVVDVERKVDSTNGGSIVRDAAVRIVKNGAIGSADRSTSSSYNLNDTNESHGSATDLWGVAWTAADINSNDFGAVVSVQKANNASGNRTVAIDNIGITVYYGLPAPKLNVTKVVVNDDGGNNVVGDFPLFVNGSAVASGVQNTFEAGAYVVTETNQDGYTATFSGACDANGNIELELGDVKECNITNDDVDTNTTITLIKNVINDNGGSAGPNDFGLTIDDDGVNSGATTEVSADVPHTINEIGLGGYEFVSITGEGCPSELGGTVTLSEGEDITCTITNNDIFDAPDFSEQHSPDFAVDDANIGTELWERPERVNTSDDLYARNIVNNSNTTHNTTHYIKATNFSFSIPSNAVIKGIVVEVERKIDNNSSGSIVRDAAVRIVKGGIIGEENRATSTAYNIEDTFEAHGSPEDLWGEGWTPADINSENFGAAIAVKKVNNAGSSRDVRVDSIRIIVYYDIPEVNAPTITLIKEVVNDDGGEAESSNFNLMIDGIIRAQDTPIEVSINEPHAINEESVEGYEFVDITGDDKCPDVLGGTVTLVEGEDITCTITNDDIAPKLTVTKVVVNDDGGNNVVGDFPLFVNGSEVASGVQNTFEAGTYIVTETNQDEYTATFSGDCDSNGNVELTPGNEKECVITNDDIAPKLTVTKVVINDDGGNKDISDFPLFVNGEPVVSGEENELEPGSYVVSETEDENYAATFSGDCDSNGNIELELGNEKECVITNDDIGSEDNAPTITLIKEVVNDDGGSAGDNAFGLKIDGTPVASGATTEVSADEEHTIDEDGLEGYDFVSISGEGCPSGLGGTVTLSEGEDITCTITNDDIAPKLTVTKVVVNEDGGTKQVSDFDLLVDDTGVVSGVQNTFEAGSYVVSETEDENYAATFSGDCDSNGNVELELGDVKECNITNDDVDTNTTITLIKNVINDNGGSASPNGFGLTIDENPVDSGETTEVSADEEYTIDEIGLEGYKFTNIAGDDKCPDVLGGTVTLVEGEDITCTITNDDIAPKLTVTKVVVNEDGGTKQVSEFPLFVNGESVVSGEENELEPGSYVVSETEDENYAATFSGDCDSNGNVGLLLGNEKECVITNDDIGSQVNAPTVTLIKEVVNDDGGEAESSNFNLMIDGIVRAQDTPIEVSVNEPHSINEESVEGYEFVDITGDDKCPDVLGGTVTLVEGEDITCTITNDDAAPKLKVTKVVINDNGGAKEADEFELFVDGNPVTSGDEITLNAGSHIVNETNDTTYSSNITGDCNLDGIISLNPGDVKKCFITNDDIAPKLSVTKIVVNDNGGAKQVSDFHLFVGETEVASGEANEFLAGEYVINETENDGYAATFSGDCDADGNVELELGDVKECVITNDDIAPKLTITKIVVNDGGGNKDISDFPLFVNGSAVVSDVQNTFDAGFYVINETENDGYAATFSGDCYADGNVELELGDVKECMITNEDIDDTAPNVNISFEDLPQGSYSLTVAQSNTTNTTTSGFLVGGKFFEINSNLQNGSFNVSLTFMYDDANNDSIVDGTAIIETSLEVYFYDGASWVTVPNPVRDTIANTITVVVDHFTTFALLSPQPPPAIAPASPSDSSGSSGSGGGGGGGTGIQYGWQCTEWSGCLPEGVQARACNLVSGPGLIKKPEETRGCSYTASLSETNQEQQQVSEQASEEETLRIAPSTDVSSSATSSQTGFAALTGNVVSAIKSNWTRVSEDGLPRRIIDLSLQLVIAILLVSALYMGYNHFYRKLR